MKANKIEMTLTLCMVGITIIVLVLQHLFSREEIRYFAINYLQIMYPSFIAALFNARLWISIKQTDELCEKAAIKAKYGSSITIPMAINNTALLYVDIIATTIIALSFVVYGFNLDTLDYKKAEFFHYFAAFAVFHYIGILSSYLRDQKNKHLPVH